MLTKEASHQPLQLIPQIKLQIPIILFYRFCARDGSGIPRFLAWIQRTARPGFVRRNDEAKWRDAPKKYVKKPFNLLKFSGIYLYLVLFNKKIF
jgi:hypothetical protein